MWEGLWRGGDPMTLCAWFEPKVVLQNQNQNERREQKNHQKSKRHPSQSNVLQRARTVPFVRSRALVAAMMFYVHCKITAVQQNGHIISGCQACHLLFHHKGARGTCDPWGLDAISLLNVNRHDPESRRDGERGCLSCLSLSHSGISWLINKWSTKSCFSTVAAANSWLSLSAVWFHNSHITNSKLNNHCILAVLSRMLANGRSHFSNTMLISLQVRMLHK